MTIAVDFDGTITQENIYPDIGAFRENAIPVLKCLQDRGHDICLWTCRSKESLALALKNLEEKGFKPNYVNCAPYSTGSQKIVANIYIDDAAWPACLKSPEERINWNEIATVMGITKEELKEYQC